MNRKLKDPWMAEPMWVYEENFRLLHDLLDFPFVAGGALYSSTVSEEELLEIGVIERSRYTLSISLRKSFSFGQAWFPDLAMEVRLYFDAKVAEVIAYQSCYRLPAPYAVKGCVPFLKDEKRQANKLLNELLEYCMSQGFRPVTEPASS